MVWQPQSKASSERLNTGEYTAGLIHHNLTCSPNDTCRISCQVLTLHIISALRGSSNSPPTVRFFLCFCLQLWSRKVDLRFLAEKQVLLLVGIFWAFLYLLRAISFFNIMFWVYSIVLFVLLDPTNSAAWLLGFAKSKLIGG